MPITELLPHSFDRSEPMAVGGIGHREIRGDVSAIDQAIRRTLQELIAKPPVAPFHLICSVAEGADRLLIDAAASLGVPYDCVLPGTPEQFIEDFTTNASRSEFLTMLDEARMVYQPEPSVDKEAGYMWASNTVLERCNLLVAVWDGGPGNGPAGTSATVTSALKQGIPVIWIPVEPPYRARLLESNTDAVP